MNGFSTDSGFRPPSPISFSPSGPGLFDDHQGYDDFRFGNQDFMSMPHSPTLNGVDPSFQLFNQSEQRYFSEFLDALVVDQEFTFDPTTIANLPTLPLFSQEPSTLPGGMIDSLMLPASGMDYDMNGISSITIPMTSSPSSSPLSHRDSFSSSIYSRNANNNNGGFPSPQQGESPASPSSSTSSIYTATSGSNKQRKTSRGLDTSAKRGTMDDGRITAPIQQLSNLSLNNNKKSRRRDDDDEHRHHKSPSVDDSLQFIKERTTGSESGDEGSMGSEANGSSNGGSNPKRKPYKELLTEEEKRANHIASEQKRRNTIRNGFKDMTDIIPDLKDINSSKSTILFKAVDFIKHLENRNRSLEVKAAQLEARMEQQHYGGRNDQSYQSQQDMYHHSQHHHYRRGSSGLDDKRLQDIPHLYPLSSQPEAGSSGVISPITVVVPSQPAVTSAMTTAALATKQHASNAFTSSSVAVSNLVSSMNMSAALNMAANGNIHHHSQILK